MQATSLYWFAAKQKTNTLTRQKCSFSYAKFRAEFNGISLFLWKHQEGVANWLKLKLVQKNANRRLRRLRAKRQVKTPRGATNECSFVLFYYFLLFNTKRLKMKAFVEVSLVSLNLRSRTAFKNFWKNGGNFAVLVCSGAEN